MKLSQQPTADNFVCPDPSPAEEAAARAKEVAEQEALPYKWQQHSIAEVNITFTVPGNMKSRDLVIDIKKQSLSAGIKGQDPIIKVQQDTVQPFFLSHPKSHSHISTYITPITRFEMIQ